MSPVLDPRWPAHDWRIEEREYARHEARRGRRHAYPRLDPRRTALVVVDLVAFFVEQNDYCRGIVPVVSSLADDVREAGGVIAWVVPTDGEPSAERREFYGPVVAETMAHTGAGGTPRERVWPELPTHDGDLYAEKSTHSSFFPGGSDLDARLRGRGVENVVVAGTLTNVCVEGTVRDASTLGYRVVLVADGCAARRDEDHNATLHTVYRTFGDVRPAAEVREVLGL